jgi:hypothetical protein
VSLELAVVLVLPLEQEERGLLPEWLERLTLVPKVVVLELLEFWHCI